METVEPLGYSSSAMWKLLAAIATHLIHNLTMEKGNVGLLAKAEPKRNSRRNTREIKINFMVDSVLALTACAGEPGGGGRKEAILRLRATDFVNKELIKNFLELRRWHSLVK